MGENKPYDVIQVGDAAAIERVCTERDLVLFAHASGDLNPLHLPDHDGDGVGARLEDATAPSMWVGSLFSAILGNTLPGAGTEYRGQTLRFADRVRLGDRVRAEVVVTAKREGGVVSLACTATKVGGGLVAEGEAEVLAPIESARIDEDDLPEVLLHSHAKFDALIAACEGLAPLRVAVAAPESDDALEGPLLAADRGLAAPILVGDETAIRAAADRIGRSLDGVEIVAAPDHDAAAAAAVALVGEGRADAVMKGHLHTSQFLGAAMARSAGLRGARRISHAFAIDAPGTADLFIVTDAAINIAPDLETKVDIVQNAIDLARALGMDAPRVGVLSAIETVNPKIPSTLDAAVLSKMAERGQIKGGIVDGPLAMDNAVDIEAARTKGIRSLVAGRAQVLVPPNMEAANMLAKELTFLAHAECAGIVLGARAPIILTSRADDERARLTSCALAQLYAYWLREGRARVAPTPTREPAPA